MRIVCAGFVCDEQKQTNWMSGDIAYPNPLGITIFVWWLPNPKQNQKKSDVSVSTPNQSIAQRNTDTEKYRTKTKQKKTNIYIYTFVFPSLNNNFIPSLMNSGWEMNSNVTVARSPVRNTPWGWSIPIIRTVCRMAWVTRIERMYRKNMGIRR